MPKARIKPVAGWSNDLPPEEIGPGFLTDMFNTVSNKGVLGRAFPFAPRFTGFTEGPRWLLPNQTPSDAFFLVAEDTRVEVTDGVTVADITPAGGWSDFTAISQPYTGGVINNLPVINSPLDGPYYWEQDIATPSLLLGLPGWAANAVCQSMRPFGNFLVAMAINDSGDFPDLLRWSDAAPPGDVPQNWTAAVDSQAGEVSVGFNPGPLVDGLQLLDRFFVYKNTSTYVLTLIGGVFIFNQRPVFSTVGMLARSCAIEYRGQHIVLTDGDLVIHDGLNVQSLANERLRRVIFDSLDGDNADATFMSYANAINALVICRPLAGQTYPSDAITIDLDTFAFGHQKLLQNTPHLVDGIVNDNVTAPTTWDNATDTWETDPNNWNSAATARITNHVIFADFDGLQLQQIGLGTDQDGAPLNALAQRVNLDLDQPGVRKYVRRVWPRFHGGDGNEIFISIGANDVANLDPTYGPEQRFVIGTDRYVSVDISGNYLAYRFRSELGTQWRLPAFDIEFDPMGEF
jgi:hypothetical protein